MPVSGGPDIAESGIVLSLDAADAYSYPGSGSSWFDLSGNNNHCTLTGTAFSTSNGGILTFNGTSDFGNITTMTNLNNQFSTNEVWVRFNNPTAARAEQVLSRSNLNAGTFNILKNISTLLLGNFRNGSNVLTSVIQPTSTLTTNWTHLVFSYNGTTLSLYQNGQQIATASNSGVINTDGTLVINIGRNTTGGAFFEGSMGIARIYNRGLSASEVLQNFDANKSRFGL